MTLVFVAKGMQVANPVGTVNIHPLPSLPAGLSRAHLLRTSLEMVALNLVNGEPTGIAETKAGGGVLTYHPTYVHTTNRASGWIDQNWNVPSALTWMAVAFWDADAPTELLNTSDYMTPDPASNGLTFQPGYLRMSGPGDASLASVAPIPEGPLLGFGAVDWAAQERRTFVPHNGNFDATSFDPGEFAPVTQGVTISAAIGATARNARLCMVAQWDRVLSQSEMTDAYNALKPWLLARGVTIA